MAVKTEVGTIDSERTSRYKWPYQHKPTVKEWEVWKKVVHYVWQPLLLDAQSHRRLGDWKREMHQTFHFGWDNINNRVIGQINNEWYIFEVIDGCYTSYLRRNKRLRIASTTREPDNKPIPISIRVKEGPDITIDGKIEDGDRWSSEVREDAEDDPVWWNRVLYQMDQKDRELLNNTRVLCDGEEFKKLIVEDRAIIVSDGSCLYPGLPCK